MKPGDFVGRSGPPVLASQSNTYVRQIVGIAGGKELPIQIARVGDDPPLGA